MLLTENLFRSDYLGCDRDRVGRADGYHDAESADGDGVASAGLQASGHECGGCGGCAAVCGTRSGVLWDAVG